MNDNSKTLNQCCVDGMKQFPDKYFDLAVVDPPFGINVTKMTLGNGKRKVFRGSESWDDKIPDQTYFDELFRVSKNQVIFGGNYMTEFLKPTGAWLFWDKGTGENDFADGELAWTSFKGTLRKIKKTWIGANAKDESKRFHPTQKPVYLYDWIFQRYTKPGDKVIDTHLGSGSSRIAANKNNLDFIGFEIDPKYFQLQERRFSNFVSQQRLFEI